MNLISRLGNKIGKATCGLVAVASSFFYGCENTTPGEQGTALGVFIAGMPKSKTETWQEYQRRVAVGNALAAAAQARTQIEAAQAGKPETNISVNVNVPGQQTSEQSATIQKVYEIYNLDTGNLERRFIASQEYWGHYVMQRAFNEQTFPKNGYEIIEITNNSILKRTLIGREVRILECKGGKAPIVHLIDKTTGEWIMARGAE